MARDRQRRIQIIMVANHARKKFARELMNQSNGSLSYIAAMDYAHQFEGFSPESILDALGSGYSIMLMVDESSEIASSPSAGSINEDQKAEIQRLIGDVVELGRAAAVEVIVGANPAFEQIDSSPRPTHETRRDSLSW